MAQWSLNQETPAFRRGVCQTHDTEIMQNETIELFEKIGRLWYNNNMPSKLSLQKISLNENPYCEWLQ